MGIRGRLDALLRSLSKTLADPLNYLGGHPGDGQSRPAVIPARTGGGLSPIGLACGSLWRCPGCTRRGAAQRLAGCSWTDQPTPPLGMEGVHLKWRELAQKSAECRGG